MLCALRGSRRACRAASTRRRPTSPRGALGGAVQPEELLLFASFLPLKCAVMCCTFRHLVPVLPSANSTCYTEKVT